MIRQIPNVILGNATIADNAQHLSIAFPVIFLQEKKVQVFATRTGAPTNLLVSIQLAPENLPLLYTTLGTPGTLVITGSLILPWTTHSEWAQVMLQCPAYAGVPANDFWSLFVYFEGFSV